MVYPAPLSNIEKFLYLIESIYKKQTSKIIRQFIGAFSATIWKRRLTTNNIFAFLLLNFALCLSRFHPHTDLRSRFQELDKIVIHFQSTANGGKVYPQVFTAVYQ